jgi:hypothetical protein
MPWVLLFPRSRPAVGHGACVLFFDSPEILSEEMPGACIKSPFRASGIMTRMKRVRIFWWVRSLPSEFNVCIKSSH